MQLSLWFISYLWECIIHNLLYDMQQWMQWMLTYIPCSISLSYGYHSLSIKNKWMDKVIPFSRYCTRNPSSLEVIPLSLPHPNRPVFNFINLHGLDSLQPGTGKGKKSSVDQCVGCLLEAWHSQLIFLHLSQVTAFSFHVILMDTKNTLQRLCAK